MESAGDVDGILPTSVCSVDLAEGELCFFLLHFTAV